MLNKKRIFALAVNLLFILGCFHVATVDSQEIQPPTELLWSDRAPGAIGNEEADKPSLTICLAPKEIATGAAVVICPGGAYAMLALDHEGRQVAKWLNSVGVSAFILKYRIAPRYHHPAPLLDAQRAIRTVRARSQEWNIDPARIGIIGFSAGGHLASTAGTHFDKGNQDAKDIVERANCQPNFMILVYPVISFTTEYTHVGSRKNLIGNNPDSSSLMINLSNERQVTPDTPPTFLIHTSGDKGVAAENSVLFYLALRRAGVPAELHIYEKGGHGFGLAPNDPVLSNWPKVCVDWMRGRGLLMKKE